MSVEERTAQGSWPGACEGARAGRRNRVRPDGEFVADPGRGLFWGNRGSLLGAAGQPTRRPSTRAWICCVLEFKGWRRVQWQPGRLTERYFLDEVTALAAGHRPCGLCRVPDYQRFRRSWTGALGGGLPGAPETDGRLEADRRTPEGCQRTFRAAFGDCRTVCSSGWTARPGWCGRGAGCRGRWPGTARRDPSPRASGWRCSLPR